MRVQCAWCLKEQIGTGVWVPRAEKLVGSHTVCPDCARKLHAELAGMSTGRRQSHE